jgi:hypothetical protein
MWDGNASFLVICMSVGIWRRFSQFSDHFSNLHVISVNHEITHDGEIRFVLSNHRVRSNTAWTSCAKVTGLEKQQHRKHFYYPTSCFSTRQVMTSCLLGKWCCVGLLDPEDEGITIIRNVGNYSPHDTRLQSSATPLPGPHNSWTQRSSARQQDGTRNIVRAGSPPSTARTGLPLRLDTPRGLCVQHINCTFTNTRPTTLVIHL